jgi:hypothetical protein
MITPLLHLLRLLPFLCGGHRRLAIENLALRQQLAVYKRTAPRPRLCTTDRLFWVGLARVWTGWRQALVIVSPTTVVRWQRRRFRAYWTPLSGRPPGGRPPVNAEFKVLVTRMAAANSLWGAPRIHGELRKLGIDVAEPTVSRLLTKRRGGSLWSKAAGSPASNPLPAVSSLLWSVGRAREVAYRAGPGFGEGQLCPHERGPRPVLSPTLLAKSLRLSSVWSLV